MMSKNNKALNTIAKKIRQTTTAEDLATTFHALVSRKHASCVEIAFRDRDGKITHRDSQKLAEWDKHIITETARQIREMFVPIPTNNKSGFHRRHHSSERIK